MKMTLPETNAERVLYLITNLLESNRGDPGADLLRVAFVNRLQYGIPLEEALGIRSAGKGKRLNINQAKMKRRNAALRSAVRCLQQVEVERGVVVSDNQACSIIAKQLANFKPAYLNIKSGQRPASDAIEQALFEAVDADRGAIGLSSSRVYGVLYSDQ